ncbi:MAG: ABC transporter ATP-binding protein/permease [Acidimicrobiia bacterium]|nr:ABC transporter ATP-binding protein/permease [Acidimicrobiia bacterium]
MMRGGLELVDENQPPAMRILRRGLAGSPELRRGLGITVAFALLSALARLVLPVLVQQTLDRGFEDGSVDVGFVVWATVFAGLVILVIYGLTTVTYRRVIRVAENTLLAMRLRTFAHIQRLSMAEHVESKKGTLTARVTSDVETLAQFAQWGALAWIVDSALIIGTLGVMAFYSWQLALLTIAVYVPLLPILRHIQRRQLRAYNAVRTRIADTLSRTSEALSGAATIRAYGYQGAVADRLDQANRDLVQTQTSAHRFFSILAPTMDLFGGLATGAVAVAGVLLGPANLTVGEATAFLFLVTILIQPIAQLGEVLDQTQTALAGWWKILQVLDTEIDVVEPEPGIDLPAGAPSVEIDRVSFAYRIGGPVLDDVSISIPPGTAVAIVGETGSGKTTLAKLLARLADPVSGSIRIGGVDLREVSEVSRHRVVRMVPQDGFLFDTTLAENIRFGRPEATDSEIEAAVEALDLTAWVDQLPGGLETPAGERGEGISVGERQLVALIRAQLADAGLLILDEATSAVDPDTEVRMASALERLSRGRTTISIAHRLSTAERSDLVLVMDDGRLVESGSHDDLLTLGGTYAALHADWVGNTQTA